jgi:hypothetical protein
MTTVQQIFDMAIHLMDEQSETSGVTLTTDTQEYKFRTISVLNAVMPALYPYSDTCDRTGSGRPVCPALAVGSSPSSPDFTQAIPLDDTLSLGLLPYALAAHLLANENEELSSWFLRMYSQCFGDLRSKIPASFEPIPLPYGGI